MDKEGTIYCDACGASLRGRFCWRCGTASSAWKQDGAPAQGAAERPVVRTPTAAGYARLAVVAAIGVVALAFPAAAIVLGIAYLTLVAWSAMKESRRAAADRTSFMDVTRS